VFDGTQGDYRESDQPNPLSIYGETKALAEELVLRNPNHTVIRTSLNGGQSPTGDRGFNEELRRVLRNGQTMNLFTDEYRSPMAAKVTARALWELLAVKASGIFHIAGAEKLSRYEIGRVLTEGWGESHGNILAGRLKDYNGPPRAPDTSLCCDKASRILSFPLPSFTQWLKEHAEEPF
jgi:dTDP-4-dehydrorhamnose reductase